MLQLRNDHLTISIKLVGAGQNSSTVGKGLAFHVLLAQINLGILGDLVPIADEIKVSVEFYELISLLLYAANIEIIIIRTSQKRSLTILAAIIVVDGVVTISAIGVQIVGNTGLHITLAVEEVGLTIDLVGSAGVVISRGILIVIGAVPVASAGIGGNPNVLSHTSVIKDKFDAAICGLLTVDACKGNGIEVVPVVVNTNPVTGQTSDNGIVVLTVNILQTGTRDCATTVTRNLSFDSIHLICMTGCGIGNFTPFYGRVAFIAEGTALIAGRRAGGSDFTDRNGRMNVGRSVLDKIGFVDRLVGGIHFGIHVEFFVGEGGLGTVNVGDKTHVNVHLHILREEVVGSPVGLSRETGYLDIRIEVEDTDGERCQNGLASLRIGARTGDSEGSRVGFLVDRIISGEAFSQYHVLELPVVDTVQVDHGLYGLNGFDVGCFEVHPVDRTKVNSVEGRICGNEAERRIFLAGFNLDHTDNDGFVARVITNFEFNSVITVGNLVVLDGDHAVFKGTVDCNAVDVSLCGSGVQAGNVIKRLFDAHRVS